MNALELRQRIAQIPEANQDTPEFARLLNDFAVTCHNSNFSEAEALYKRSLAIWERQLGANHPNVGVSLLNLSALYRKTRRFHEAERLLQLSQGILREKGPPTDGDGPLRVETYDLNHALQNFGADVRDLRARADAGSAEALRELQEIIVSLGPWYHNLNLSGCSTLPATPDYPASRWRLLNDHVPRDLSGKTVLDIGCNSGFFALEMKRRGAERVVGIDIMPHVLAQARFVSHWFGTPIELYESSAYDVERLGIQFDIVLFIGVLYHLKHPLYALEKIASVCRETMFLMSMVRGSKGDFAPANDYPGDEVRIFDHPDYPRLYFVEKSFNGDESNWWMATKSCLKAMVRVVGFPTIEEIDHPEYLICRK